MHDPSSLREQARRCRALAKTAVEPEVIEQFRVWAVELAEEADQVEWGAAQEEETIFWFRRIAPRLPLMTAPAAAFPPQAHSRNTVTTVVFLGSWTGQAQHDQQRSCNAFGGLANRLAGRAQENTWRASSTRN